MEWSTHDISYLISFCAKLLLVFAIFNLALCILAPLLGGKFVFSGVLIYGGWVGFALCGLFEARRIKAKQIDDAGFKLISIFGIFCWIFSSILMFPFPYNVLGATLGGAFFLFLKRSWYKRFKKEISAQKIK